MAEVFANEKYAVPQNSFKTIISSSMLMEDGVSQGRKFTKD